MKKRKFIIWLNFVTICLSICAIAIGVYSIKTATLNVNGAIGFTAHNCKVSVLGEITGAVNENNVALDPATTSALRYQNNDGTAKLIDGTADTWDFGNIYFDDLNPDKYNKVNDIVFTFTITNESDYYVDVKVNQTCINNNRIFIYAPNNGKTLAPKGQGAASSVTLTVKLQLQKDSTGKYSSLGSTISLSNATLLIFEKSQAPSYLATNWKDKIITAFTLTDLKNITSISFLRELKPDTLKGFDKTVSVGAVNATSPQSDLTNNKNVTDIIAYYNSTSKEIIVYSPARIYAPESCVRMFFSCSALANLELRNLDTSKVTDMSTMFAACGKLTSLDLSNFNTSNVTSMGYMFSECTKLTSLDVSNFNTSSVTNMGYMFCFCSGLTSLDVSNFNTSNVTNMSSMFYSCSKLASLDVSSFNTSSVTYMNSMFYSCEELTSLDVRNFNTSNVTYMDSMFSSCSKLASLDVSSFDTSKVTSMSAMFAHCSKLASLDVSSFNTSSVTYMNSMFSSCEELTSLDLSNFNTSKVEDMNYMFSGCSKLSSLDVSSFNTSKVKIMYYMFSRCSAFTSLDLSNFNTSNVTDMNMMFSYCSKLTNLDVSNFETSNVTDMNQMFDSCSALKTIYVNSTDWNTKKVTASTSMFFGCTNLVGGNGTKYNSNITDKEYARVDAPSNPGYFTGK